MSIQLTTLGGLRVLRDGQALDTLLAQRLRCALLVYLVVEGRSTRDRVLGLLWPDRSPEKARHSLSQTLYELRKDLGEDWLEVRGETLQVNPAVTVDAAELLAAADAGRSERVLEVYAGPFLPGAPLVGGHDYESWVERTRTRLARIHRTAARRIVASLEESGDLEQAVKVAATWAEHDPLDDEAHHAWIALLARLGRRSEALQRHEAYAALLARELDVQPWEQTRALVAEIRAQGDAASGPAEASGPGHPAQHRPEADGPEVPGPAREPAPASSSGAEPAPESALDALITFVEELRRRRVTRVALAYMVVAVAFLEGADLLLGPLGAPTWLQPVLTVLVVLGFPFVLVLAWVFDLTPRGLEMTQPVPGATGGVADRVARRALGALALVTVLGVVGIWTWRSSTRIPLDVNRVMVFPLVTPDTDALPSSVGEDVATMIGHALDRTGPLRWIDGWTLLQPDQRNNVRLLTDDEARTLARSRGCAFYVHGRIVDQGGRATVFLDLWDAGTGTVVGRAEAEGPLGAAWQSGLRAVSGLLPRIVVSETVPDAYLDDLRRDPAAVASFLLGERAFRRAASEQAMDHYRAALEADPTFVLAATKGALAAAWAYDDQAILQFTEAAARADRTAPQQALLEGLHAYALGRGDATASATRRAIAEDEESPEAWTLRGEGLWHLTPRTPNPDEGAREAFSKAYRLDPTGFGPMLHSLQLALMEGRRNDAEPLLARFRLQSQNAGRDAQIAMMERCTRETPSLSDWSRETLDHPGWTLNAARLLAAAGRNMRCAEAGFRGILALEEGPNNTDRRRALLGLQGVLLAEERQAEALALLDAATRSDEDLRAFVLETANGGFDPGMQADAGYVLALDPDATPVILDQRAQALMMMQAAAGRDVGTRAAEIVELQYELLGSNFQHAQPDNFELYRLGIVEAAHGRLEVVDRIAAHMEAVADSANPLSHALAGAVRGHEALARGDTVMAIRRFQALRTEGPRRFLLWSYADPLPLERVLEARALLSLNSPVADQEALDIASTLDGFALAYLPYLAASLEIRIEAARRLGRPALEDQLRGRLKALRRSGETASRATDRSVPHVG